MKSKKRQDEKTKKQEARKQHGKPGAGKSKFALKQKVDNRPGSPFRTNIKFVDEKELQAEDLKSDLIVFI